MPQVMNIFFCRKPKKLKIDGILFDCPSNITKFCYDNFVAVLMTAVHRDAATVSATALGMMTFNLMGLISTHGIALSAVSHFYNYAVLSCWISLW
jgi:hypothetical protein